jgi:hypothetical protein
VISEAEMIAHWATSERGRVRDGKRNISSIERHNEMKDPPPANALCEMVSLEKMANGSA